MEKILIIVLYIIIAVFFGKVQKYAFERNIGINSNDVNPLSFTFGLFWPLLVFIRIIRTVLFDKWIR